MASKNGITNTEIGKFFNDGTNENLKRNFIGVYFYNTIK